eukprot:403338326
MAVSLHNLAKPGYDPKYVHYQSNGGGRDSYVFMNNQGLTKAPSFAYEGLRGSSPRKYYNPSPRKEASPVQYISDGSGRDSYVTLNSGNTKRFKEQITIPSQEIQKSIRIGILENTIIYSSKNTALKLI